MSNKNQLVTIHNGLEKLLREKQGALPKDFNQTRFLQNCMTVLIDIKDIENINPQSVSRTLLKGAFLGLDFFNKECYAIPYNRKEGTQWVKDIQFQTDYKGERKLARKYAQRPVKDIYAKLVREGDLFEEEVKNGEATINFKPLPFNDSEILGAFAVCLYQDGTMIYETMSKSEIEFIKLTYSKTNKEGQYSAAWRDATGEMYKKTVLRRLCKGIDLDFDTSDQQEAFQESSDFDFEKEAEKIEVKKITKSAVEKAFENQDITDAETGEIIEEESRLEHLIDLCISKDIDLFKLSKQKFDKLTEELNEKEIEFLIAEVNER